MRYAQYDIDAPTGKFAAIVKLQRGMTNADARADAISLARAAFGISARVGSDGKPLKSLPADAWQERKAAGWGWIARRSA